jgi:hypothetical protein
VTGVQTCALPIFAETPLSFLNIFSLSPEPDQEAVLETVEMTQSACLFALAQGE